MQGICGAHRCLIPTARAMATAARKMAIKGGLRSLKLQGVQGLRFRICGFKFKRWLVLLVLRCVGFAFDFAEGQAFRLWVLGLVAGS